MLATTNTIYFSREEMRDILDHYGYAIHNIAYKYSEKIPYDAYRRLRDCPKGIVVLEDANGKLWFYNGELEAADEPLYAKDNMGNKLIRFAEHDSPLIMATTPECEFHDYFVNYHLKLRSDYHPPKIKEEDTMAVTLQTNKSDEYPTCCCLNDTATATTWHINTNEYGNTTTATSPVIHYDLNRFNNNATWEMTMDNVTLNAQLLEELAGTAQTTAGAISNLGTEIGRINKQKKEKENRNMKGFNFDFGSCIEDNVRMSMYGIAVKNQAGEWVSYNSATEQIVNVDIFNFEGGKYMFKIPVAPNQVSIGDVIIHNKKAMFVLDLDEKGFIVVDPHAGEEKKVVPTSNCFGFNFITKVVSMFDACAATPNADSPFGNMLPLMMMSEDNKNIDPMMMMFMMGQNGNMGDLFSNPMMMYFLMKDGSKSDMLPLMLMMGQFQAPKTKNGK